MSLRVLIGLLVALAVVMVPVTSSLLLQWWPPPDLKVNFQACVDHQSPDAPCLPFRGPAHLGEQAAEVPGHASQGEESTHPQASGVRHRPPGPPPGTRFDGRDVPGFGGGPGGFVRTIHFGGPDASGVRRHFLIINLISLALIVLVVMALVSLMLRRPFRALLAAIGDIERGVAPPAWAFTGPVEFQRVGSALEKLGRQLRSNLQERELMLAGLSHDLRSPLARIQAALELRAVDGENWIDTLRDVREIDHIVGQCIDYARDGQDEPTQIISLDAIVSAALTAQASAGLELDLAAPQELPLHASAMRRALRNLVDNAKQYGQPPIVVRTRVAGDEAVLSVEDAGSGIAVESWEQLCRPFARGGSARHPSGCGLGLAIVQRVADMHGGRLLRRAARPGQAFAIELHLPVRERI